MNPFGILGGLISVIHQNSVGFITVLQNPVTGELMSIIIDDGIQIKEYDYSKRKTGEHGGSGILQPGFIA